MLDDVLREFNAEEVSAMHVYRDIFWLGEGLIQRSGEYDDLKGNPIGYFWKRGEEHGHFRIFLDDTFEETLKEMQEADFAILNGLTYFGDRNEQAHASKMYAMIFDLDGVTDKTFYSFLYGAFNGESMGYDLYPLPNYVILSGHGVHLYYLFEKPIPLYPNIKIQLKAFKYALTERLWNGYTSEAKRQYQGINQGFRVIGGKTKIKGVRVRAFHLSNHPYTLEELGKFVPDKEFLVDESKLFRESTMTLEEAKEAYPEWYQDKIINKQPRRYWDVKTDLYEWWKREILSHTDDRFGHRYFSIMCLAIYGAKCNVPYEQVKADALDLIPFMNLIVPVQEFTKDDVMSALECYDKKFCTFPRGDMEKISGIPIKKNKRNYRTQELHLKIARGTRDILHPEGWQNREGRPRGSGTAQEKVQAWRAEHPDGKKIDCHRETGLSRVTIDKWWE